MTRDVASWEWLSQASSPEMVHHGVMDRAELGTFLRQARARVAPGDVGLPAGQRRRVAGLRREEVAQLAHISVDHLTRLEQGRGSGVSESVLGSLARALQLTDDERTHLFHLAGVSPPQAGRIDGVVRASTMRILERLGDLPVLVLDAKGDVLAWNDLAAALLGDFSAWPPPMRNIVWQRFLGAERRVSVSPEEDARTAAESVANLRALSARYPEDPGLSRLLDELMSSSPRFAQLWAEARPAERRSSRKTVRHPEIGEFTLDCDSLQLLDTDQRLIIYSAAPNSPEAEALALLRVVGLQRLGHDHDAASGSHASRR
jgi:transcriptional regulator with XRE-family HTH domain